MTNKTDKDAKKHKIDTSNCRPAVVYGNVVIKTEKPEVIYLIDIGDGDLVWCDDPEPSYGVDSKDVAKYISADTSISKQMCLTLIKEAREELEAKHLEAMKALRKACDDAFWKYEQTGPATISRAILSATIDGKE